MAFELMFNIVLILILARLYYLTISYTGLQISSDAFGPGGFPRLLLALSILILVYLSIGLVKKIKLEPKTNPLCVFIAPGGLRVLVCFLVLSAYILTLETLGYSVSTFVFIILMGRTIGYKSNTKIIVFSAVLTSIMIVCFGNVFSTPLPRGIGLLRELSFFLY